MTYIYIIGAAFRPVKIGVANNPDARCYVLQTGCPFDIEVMFAEEFDRRGDAIAVEQEVHRELAEHRLSGEWFDVAPHVAGNTIGAVRERLGF